MVRRLRLLIISLVIIAAVVLATLAYESNVDRFDVGGRAKDLHSGPYATVGVELDWQAGASPDEVPLSRTLDFIHRYTGKIVFSTGSEFGTAAKTCYTTAEAIALSDAHKDHYSFAFGYLFIHYTFLNAYNCASNHIAGMSYDATDMVIFMPTVRSCVVPPIGSLAPVQCSTDQVLEAAAMSHESGHLMGLCAIAMPDNQGICDGTGHARDPMSLMAPTLNPASPNVQNLLLEPAEVAQLNELS